MPKWQVAHIHYLLIFSKSYSCNKGKIEENEGQKYYIFEWDSKNYWQLDNHFLSEYCQSKLKETLSKVILNDIIFLILFLKEKLLLLSL